MVPSPTKFVTTECPNGHRVRGDLGWLNREVKCPHCHAMFTFTRPESTAAEVLAVGSSPVSHPRTGEEPITHAERIERSLSDTGVMRILSDYAPPLRADHSTRRCPHCGATFPGDVTTCYSCNIELEPPEKQLPAEEIKSESIEFQAVDTFPFHDVAVRKVMRPRKQIVHLDINDPLEKMLARVRDTMHSRYPICDRSLDGLVGVAHIKDLLNADERNFDIESITKPPALISEATPVSEALEHFANDQDVFALVIDEYETIIGMITAKDVLLKMEKK